MDKTTKFYRNTEILLFQVNRKYFFTFQIKLLQCYMRQNSYGNKYIHLNILPLT